MEMMDGWYHVINNTTTFVFVFFDCLSLPFLVVFVVLLDFVVVSCALYSFSLYHHTTISCIFPYVFFRSLVVAVHRVDEVGKSKRKKDEKIVIIYVYVSPNIIADPMEARYFSFITSKFQPTLMINTSCRVILFFFFYKLYYSTYKLRLYFIQCRILSFLFCSCFLLTRALTCIIIT